jgi:hydrogenase maturation protease
MMISTGNRNSVLILGIGNILMGDEGIGVHVVNALEEAALPDNVECLDGGVGSFLLLEPMQSVDKVILIDATIDGRTPGSVRRLQPKFSTDYPNTLTAHDIGLKDLLDAFYLMGRVPDVTLFAISIPPLQDMVMELSPELRPIVPEVAKLVLEEALIQSSAPRSSALCA